MNPVFDKHNIYIPYIKTSKSIIISNLKDHKCDNCSIFFSIFEPITNIAKYNTKKNKKLKYKKPDLLFDFPPDPLKKEKIKSVITKFCQKAFHVETS